METERLRNLWPWEPLTEEQNAWLRTLAPDRALGRAAAVEYLDSHKPEVIEISPPIIMPIAIILILVALIGLTAGWTFR